MLGSLLNPGIIECHNLSPSLAMQASIRAMLVKTTQEPHPRWCLLNNDILIFHIDLTLYHDVNDDDDQDLYECEGGVNSTKFLFMEICQQAMMIMMK